MISSSVSFPVLENLMNCTTVASMWATLCSFYQQKSKENVYMLQNNFFEYNMSPGDSINTYINKVTSIGNLLKEMLLTKIICSLPSNYNSIITAWANVPAADQTVANLKVILLQLENVMALQNAETNGDATFFTRSNHHSHDRSNTRSNDRHNDRSSSRSNDHSSRSSNKGNKQQPDHNRDYIRDRKSRTRCYNCRQLDHWIAECPHPRQDRTKFLNQRSQQHSRQHRDTNIKPCVAATEPIHSDCSENSNDSCAFMIVSRHSHALSVNLDKAA